MLSLDLTDPDHAKPGKLEPFLREPVNQVDPVFSPDRAVDCVRIDDEATCRRSLCGDFQVFPHLEMAGLDRPRKFPIWSRNSRELYYLTVIAHYGSRYQTSDDVFTAEKPRQWSSMPLFRPLINSLWNLDVARTGNTCCADAARSQHHRPRRRST